MTNIMFLWLGALGIRSCYRESHSPIFIIAYLGYIIVGLGSISFHATLKCTDHSLFFPRRTAARNANRYADVLNV